LRQTSREWRFFAIPPSPSQTAQFGAIQTAAPSLRVEVIPVNMRDASEIERAIANFARSANGSLIPTSSAVALQHRNLIIALTARHKLPAIYWDASSSMAAA
jgi:putative ABC transport system substrate-binding protein